jgi:YVTN family beta-propeller protein
VTPSNLSGRGRSSRRRFLGTALGVLLAVAFAGCTGVDGSSKAAPTASKTVPVKTAPATTALPPPVVPVPGMPPVIDTRNIYSEAGAGAGAMSPATAGALPRVYVPNLKDNTVSVIDPATLRVVDTFRVGTGPQHIVPSYDLRTLWVTNNAETQTTGSVTPIDPKTGKPGAPITVDDPYNMYFTPDGRSAIVVAEAARRLDFRDPHTMKLQYSIPLLHCSGLNHADFSVDGRYLIASCEFRGALVKVDLVNRRLVGYLQLAAGAMPQDVRTSPDGKTLFVAEMSSGKVLLIDPDTLTIKGSIPTGIGPHGLYFSRDSTKLYVSNRGLASLQGIGPHGPGSISVIDLADDKVVANWAIPGGGSPDMGNVSADGRYLWLSGRYDRVVYRFDTASGAVATVAVGRQPHGLAVWPQPGRYSLGHTGIMR